MQGKRRSLQNADKHASLLLVGRVTRVTHLRGSYPKRDRWAVSLPHASPGSTGSNKPFRPTPVCIVLIFPQLCDDGPQYFQKEDETIKVRRVKDICLLLHPILACELPVKVFCSEALGC